MCGEAIHGKDALKAGNNFSPHRSIIKKHVLIHLNNYPGMCALKNLKVIILGLITTLIKKGFHHNSYDSYFRPTTMRVATRFSPRAPMSRFVANVLLPIA